jgi:hypothetical protein
VGGACGFQGRGEKCTWLWWRSLNGKDHAEDRGIDGRLESEWILRRLSGGCRVDSGGSGWGPVTGCCEHGDEPSGSGTTELGKR